MACCQHGQTLHVFTWAYHLHSHQQFPPLWNIVTINHTFSQTNLTFTLTMTFKVNSLPRKEVLLPISKHLNESAQDTWLIYLYPYVLYLPDSSCRTFWWGIMWWGWLLGLLQSLPRGGDQWSPKTRRQTPSSPHSLDACIRKYKST